ncbi:hypothetical protein ONZ45_g2375 [Pleurotus djamor]|nr:hypothetical protein ONZ45_g2375 [Pleurotus djamor]
MAYNHASVAAHVPQSLPPFSQAFSNTNLSNISSSGNALPPIQPGAPVNDGKRVGSPPDHSRPPSEEAPGARVAGKKRTRADITSPDRDDDHEDPERKSPRTVQIKEEQVQDSLESSTSTLSRRLPESVSSPSPASLQPSPSKRRRATTLSGAPHALSLNLNTDIRPISDQANSTPISPVVRGFTVMRDDPAAIEQVRSSITISQQQKALIEQRRGSVAGIVSPVVTRGTPPSYPSGEDRTIPKSSAPSRRRSPGPVLNTSVTRRGTLSQGSFPPGGTNRPPSPPPVIVPSQQPHQGHPSAHTLPPPPISFARRRAGLLGAGKKKPADIVISPREAHTKEQFAPSIHSAPPIPQAGGQAALYSGRFPMTLPRLPSVIGNEPGRRVGSGVVPPTPTRLAMQQRASTSSGPTVHPISGPPGRSPPVPQVPISSTLVPPTPSTLHHPGYSGDKAAFLAPFEVFYDALNDSKQLKNWLGEQLARSNTLMQSLSQQQERLNETVEMLVERRFSSMQSEILSLRRRVEELEDGLQDGLPERHPLESSARVKGKQPLRNGVADSYAFPPFISSERTRSDTTPRHMGSPSFITDKERDREYRDLPEPEGPGSPAPFDNRRITTSATRLDHARPQHHHSEVQPQSSSPQASRLAVPSPPQPYREGPGRGPSPLGRLTNSPGQTRNVNDRPSLSRQHSTSQQGSHRPDFREGRPDSPEGRQTVLEGARKGRSREHPPTAMDET